MSPQPKTPPDPASEPAAPPAAPQPGDRPGWVDEVLTELRGIPGKIRANIGDDDRRSIAEEVHKLFEPHFVRDDNPPPPSDNPPEDDPPAPAPADKPPGKEDSWARRVFGPH